MEAPEVYQYPDYPDMKPDFTIDQGYDTYTAEDHAIWKALFERQMKILPGRACSEFLDAMKNLGIVADGIPRFDVFNKVLRKASGWEVVAVPGLIPDDTFFEHLAAKRFPVTHWIRTRQQMDYLQEPDVFHDFFGHVPMLMLPVFGDYMQAYGQGGLRAMKLGGYKYLKFLARLYWYTVEFGLIMSKEGLRIYGAGIVSSKGESIFCVEDASPNRIWFDMKRIMQTNYRIDDYQETYWVIKNFQQLFDDTYQDFEPIYKALENAPDYAPGQILESDSVLHRGTGEYARRKKG